MTRLTDRFSKDRLPDTTDLRERVLEAVEAAIDRVEDAMQDAPTPKQAADRLRRQKVIRSAGTAAMAAAPTVARMARHRVVRRSARGARLAGPTVLRAHPVLFGAGLAASAITGAFLVRRALRARSAASNDASLAARHDRYVEDVDPKHFDLAEEVTRMEDEGGEPSAGHASATNGQRRFVRGADGRSTTRS